MNRKTLAFAGTLAILLAGCGEQAAPPETTAAPASLPSGIDLAGMDRNVVPGDDFFAYANGTWLANTPIPADRSSTGAFLVAFEKTQEAVTAIIEGAADDDPTAGTDARRIADFHRAWMDTDAIEKHGLAPLAGSLAEIDAIATREDLARVLGNRLAQDVDPINATDFHTSNLFGLFVAQGLEDPSRNMAYLLQGGLAMPSPDYYLGDDPAMTGFRDAYAAYVQDLLAAAETPDAAAQAARVLALETEIAATHANLVDSEDVHKANNSWRREDFVTQAPGLDWATWFAAAGLDGEEVIGAWQPEAIRALSALTASAPLEDWKALLRFHTLDAAAPLLPAKFASLHFNFYSATLQGVQEQRERGKRAVDATSDALGFAVGKLYVERYFPASAKAAAQAMTDDIIAAFAARLDQLEWMTPATREKAREKLKTLKVRVGYPDHWPSLEGLEITPDDALTNTLNAERFHTRQRLAALGQPVDPDHWWMTPQTVNAINLPLENEMQFPAAILQPPFFDAEADPARNYGAIGAIIGHEISHSFDNMGAQFDAEGRLRDWWTPEDKAHFETASALLAAQFDAYEALPGLHLDGRQTLGENIADLAGLTMAHLAWREAHGADAATEIDGLDGEQRFFLAFAQAWRGKMRDAALRQRVTTDVHAPGQFRALTVRNLDAWYDAFDVETNQRLYLAPGDRIRIW